MPVKPPVFAVGDILVMKKNHACAQNAKQFRVLRVGSDIRMVCTTCSHDVTIPRIKLEKNIKSVIRNDAAPDGETTNV